MKVWITKYALTSGVFSCEATVCDTVEDGRMIQMNKDPGEFATLFHKPDWHATAGEAADRVRDMADSRRKSLQKQLDGLNSKLAKAIKDIG